MSKLRMVLGLLMTGLLASAVSPSVTQGLVPSGHLEAIEARAAGAQCESGGLSVCSPAPGWICTDSMDPDPEDVLWDYCNWVQGGDPFEWECSLGPPPGGGE